MKNILSRIVLGTVIMMSVVIFSTFISTQSVNAQSSDCGLIELFISADVIAPDKANIAREAVGCSIPVQPIQSPLNITFISKSLIGYKDGNESAAGTFKFKAIASDGDVWISNDLRAAINVEKNGVIVGKANSTVLTSNSGAFASKTGFLVQEGSTETFTIDYVMSPLQSSGYYRAEAIYLPLDGGGEVILDGSNNQFVSDHIYLTGSTTSTTTQPTITVSSYGITDWSRGLSYGVPIISYGVQSVFTRLSSVSGNRTVDSESREINRDGKDNIVVNVPKDFPLGDAKLYVIAKGESGVMGTFPGYLNIIIGSSTQPIITVTSPNGGETWARGTSHLIKWEGNQPVPTCTTNNNQTICTSIVNPRYDIYLQGNAYCPPGSACLAVSPLTQIANDIIGQQYNWLIATSTNIDNYIIRVCDANNSNVCDSSNSYFKVVAGSSNNQPPVISGITAPTTLTVNQTGTWTVNASDPENGSLTYSVNWNAGPDTVIASASANLNSGFTQTTTFTHSYSTAGTYLIRFSVKDNGGLVTQTSSTVVVTPPATTPTKPIVYATCGSANNGSFSSAPTSNLCGSGASVARSVKLEGDTKWWWSCKRNTNPAPEDTWCKAEKKETEPKPDTTVIWPKCGSASEKVSATMPSSNLCDIGKIGKSGSTSENPSRWYWSCIGQNNTWEDNAVWCFAPKSGSAQAEKTSFFGAVITSIADLFK